MYPFAYFKETDQQVVLEFLENHPFALMTGSFADGRPVATQIPMLTEFREGKLLLKGHIMRNTDHARAFFENPRCLVVFTGPSAYVSASWYQNPRIGSTWNYMSVQVEGSLRFMDPPELTEFMRSLTLKFEQGNTQSPTYFDNLPDAFLSGMMPAIAGFELVAEKVDNVFKLSQNRDEVSYNTIIAKLEEQGGDAAKIALEMKKRRDQLFPPGQEWDGTRFDS